MKLVNVSLYDNGRLYIYQNEDGSLFSIWGEA